MDLGSVNVHSKAAAWAWYQRTSGSIAARSEVALHRCVRGCPSRFKLEADHLLSDAPIQDASDRFESLHLSTDLSNSRSGATDRSDIILISPSSTTSTTSEQQISGHPHNMCRDLVVAGASSYGAAAWDCGSALFDSFELVAMSKKLDDAHQLNYATMEKVCLPAEGADTQLETGVDADQEEEKAEEQFLGNRKSVASHTLPLLNDASSLVVGIKDLPMLSEDSDTALLLLNQMQSRQAIYDMFCRYDYPEPHKAIFSEDANLWNREHMRKSKPAMSPVPRSKQYRRRRLHSFSRALRQRIAELAGRSQVSSTAHWPPDKPCLNQTLSLPAEAPAQLQPQSHSLPAESTAHLHPRSYKNSNTVLAPAGIKSMGSPFREYPPSESRGIKAPSHTLRKQYSSDSVHHHYHHHYHHHHHHYLLRRHSDEGFTPLTEPLLGADKSLLVTAAGLRMANISSLQDYLSLNPKLEGTLLDYKRKLKDANTSTGSPIQSPASPSLHV